MEDKKQFYQLLMPVRRQILFKKSAEEIQYWILSAAAFALIILMAARFFVIPFYHEIIWYGCIFLLPLFIYRIWRKRPGWREAAYVFNAYIPEDRVITALSFINQEGMLQKLQLADALDYMKKEQHRVLARKKAYFLPKRLIGGAVIVCLAALLHYFPNHNLQLAAEKETEMRVVKKVEKKLEEMAKREQNPDKKKALEKAQAIITKNPTPQKALEELAKQKKELALKTLKEQEKQDNVKAYQQELKNSGLTKLASALEKKDQNKIKKELEKLNKKYDSLTADQKKALNQLSGSDQQLSDKQVAELAKKLEAALNSGQLQKELANADTALGEAAATLQEEMQANGLASSQIALNQANQTSGTKSKGQGSKNGNSSGGKKGSNQGNKGSGKGSQSGKGNGSTGSGTGNGPGTGSGSGTGTASSGSMGNGAGFGAGSRQLLTIPEKLAGKDNFESDNGSIGSGSPSEQFQGRGPILNGQIRPYQEFYGSYADAYRNSTDRLKLPADLEEIVKNYYLMLDPNKE